jgi:hypothetical protein
VLVRHDVDAEQDENDVQSAEACDTEAICIALLSATGAFVATTAQTAATFPLSVPC